MSGINTQFEPPLRQIKILYFNVLATRLALDNETINLPLEVLTISDLIPWLMTRRGEWEDALAGELKIILNGCLVEQKTIIRDRDEVALALIAEANTS